MLLPALLSESLRACFLDLIRWIGRLLIGFFHLAGFSLGYRMRSVHQELTRSTVSYIKVNTSSLFYFLSTPSSPFMMKLVFDKTIRSFHRIIVPQVPLGGSPRPPFSLLHTHSIPFTRNPSPFVVTGVRSNPRFTAGRAIPRDRSWWYRLACCLSTWWFFARGWPLPGAGMSGGVEAGVRWVGGRQVEGLISSLDV